MVTTRRLLAAIAGIVISAGPARAQSVTMVDVPATVPAHLQRELAEAKTRITARIAAFNLTVADFNKRCEGIRADSPNAPGCTAEAAGLRTEVAAIDSAKRIFNTAVSTASIVVTDSMTVDARVEVACSELVAQVPELRGSAGATAMAKGFQAMQLRDWQLTLAWWQTAQLRDPNNQAIARAVALAQWTLDYQRKGGTIPVMRPGRPPAPAAEPPAPFVDPKRKKHADPRIEQNMQELEGVLQFISDYMRKNPR